MKTVLIISSNVASSRVGASASAFCLERLNINTIVLPTTLFGRHPGWGPPGGQITPPELLRDIWRGVKAQNLRIDGVLSGYMGHTDHVRLTREIIEALRSENQALPVLVDPVIGDWGDDAGSDSGSDTGSDLGRLYVKEAIAASIMTELLPLASLTTPNMWELGYLSSLKHFTAHALSSPQAITELTRKALPCPALISSVPLDPELGALYVGHDVSYLVTHEKFASVPHGGGDSLAGTFFAHILSGLPPQEAIARATASVFSILKTAYKQNWDELPLIHCQDALVNAGKLPVDILP